MLSPEQHEALTETLRRILDARSADLRERVREEVGDNHPVDVAQALMAIDEDVRPLLFDALSTELRADVMAEIGDIDEHAVEDFVDATPVRELAELVGEMDPDDAVDLLEVVDHDKAEAVIRELESDHAREVSQLRSHDPDTAGGIMTTEFLAVRPDQSAADIVGLLRREDEEVETAEALFVHSLAGRLLGVVHGRALMTAKPGQTASELMDKAVVRVAASTDQEVCAHLMRRYDLAILPVVDDRQAVVGIITHDDILDVLDDEAQEDMFRLAGVGDDQPLEHGAVERAVKRLPWLATTLIGMGLVGPLIMHRWFQPALDKMVILAFFMPAIMGIGGNTGIQSSTIAVRGLATGEIQFKDLLWMLRREAAVAVIIGAVCSLVIMVFAVGVGRLGFETGAAALPIGRLAATVGTAMFVGIMVSVLLGTSIPLLCDRVGVDPAIASGPFITTLIDISAQVIYFGLATWLLLG